MKYVFLLLVCFFSANLYAANPNLIPASSIPADNATGIALDANIVLNFDVTVSNSSPSGRIELFDETNNLIEAFNANRSDSFLGSEGGTGTITGNNITLNPFADFISGTGYYVLIPIDSDIVDALSPTRDQVIPVTSPTTYNFTTFAAPAQITAVPTMSVWGIGILAGLIGLFGMVRRRSN